MKQTKRKLISPAFWRCCLVSFLLAATFLAYQPAWRGEFIWDDDGHVTKPELRSVSGLVRIWIEPNATQQYYPLTHSVFWLQHKLWGDSKVGYHLVNIFLHTLAASLLFLILRRLEIPGAWLAAAIFALHPVQVESVAWISELKNTLSAVLYLGAALVYLQFDQTRKRKFYAAAFGLFVLALLSKTVVASLPAALLVIFWWKRGKARGRQDISPLVPFFAVGIVAGLFTAWVERKFIGAVGSEFDFSLVERCLIAGRAFWFYAAKLGWPFNLVFSYPRWEINQNIWWQYLFPAFAVLVLSAAWMMRRRWRGPLAGLLFFVGTLFPALGFFNIFPFRYSFVADHFQYLASLGMISLFSAGVVLMLRRWSSLSRPLGNGICVTLVAFLGFLTWSQARIYKNSETLWRDTLAKNPACSLAHNSLGSDLAVRGQTDQAIEHFIASLRLNPKDYTAHSNWAAALVRKGNIEEAIAHYELALALNPDFAKARLNLGDVLAGRGKIREALVQYETALKFNPSWIPAHYGAALMLEQLGRLDEAIEHYLATVRIDPNHAGAYNNLGHLLARKGRTDEALACSSKAVSLNPNSSQAHYNLGNAFFLKAMPTDAAAHYERAVQINPDYAEAHGNLATVYLKLGQIAQAIKPLSELVRLQPGNESAKKRLEEARLAVTR